MLPTLIMVLCIILTCFGQKEAEFTAMPVSLGEWEASEKIVLHALSPIQCGIICLTKYENDKSCIAIHYDETTSLCTLTKLAYFSKGLRHAWASSVYEGLNAWFAIDGNGKTGSFEMENIFCTGDNGDIHPWLAIDLLVTHDVTGIEIIERKDNSAQRTNNIQIRIGNTKPPDAGTNGNIMMPDAGTNGNIMIDENAECGVFIGPGDVNIKSVVTCTQPIIGRYVTLQRISVGDVNVINWSEVWIKTEKIELNTKEILEMVLKHRMFQCPPTVGFTECPGSHPYSYRQGDFCCQHNIDYDRKDSSQPLINFDSLTCKDDAGADSFIACNSPPCVNYNCQRYRC